MKINVMHDLFTMNTQKNFAVVINSIILVFKRIVNNHTTPQN